MRSNFIFILLFVLLVAVGCQPIRTDPETEALLAKLDKEGDLIVAKSFQGEIPNDPSHPAWQTTKEYRIPMVSQTSVAPRTTFKRSILLVKALVSKKEIGLRMEWDDPTKDDKEAGVGLFRDAVAVEFPLSYRDRNFLPYIGMGSKENPVNIWHWKASWQVDVDQGYQGVSEVYREMVPNVDPIPHRTAADVGSPMAQLKRTSSVENLVAEGFGTLTSTPSRGLDGKGIWQNGHWSVVIKRPRSRSGVSVDLKKGGLVPISFALWDGSSSDRNGMKGLTRWRFLRLEGEGVAKSSVAPLLVGPIPGASATKGKKLVSDLGCTSCHNLPGNKISQDVGPDLTHAGAIHRLEYLFESVKTPNAIVVPAPGYYDPKTGTSTMPTFGDQVSDEDYHHIAEYLRSLE